MATKQAPKGWTKEALIKLGFDLSHKFMEAEETFSQTRRELLLSIAKEHAGDATHIAAILEGYAQGYTEAGWKDTVVKARKTEAKAVFDAVAKTMVSGENFSKLAEFEGSYHAWADLARTLRGKKERTSTGRNRDQVLTVIQQKAIEEKIEKAATPAQLEEIASAAVKTMTIGPNILPKFAGYQTFALCVSVCQQLLTRNDLEEFVRNKADQILTLATEAVEALDKAEAAAQAAEKLRVQGAAERKAVNQEQQEAAA